MNELGDDDLPTVKAIDLCQHVADHDHKRFKSVVYRGAYWDLSHLDPFAFKVDISDNRHVVVVIFFSCHCFTHDQKHDVREIIPNDELYIDHKETRVLNEERYNFSQTLLISIIRGIKDRHITVADAGRNFVTLEEVDDNGNTFHYGVFFEVSKDNRRGGRIILRVQSAYPLKAISKRLGSARRVRFSVLIKATYEGREIKP